jgi:Putative metallopeptidase
MSRNLFNLLAIATIFVAVAACSRFRPAESNQASLPDNSTNTNAQLPKNYSPAQMQDKGDFIVQYSEIKNEKYAEIDRRIKADKTLEKAADKLNRVLMLPKDVFLRAKDCNETNASFDPNDNSITVCYELMEHFHRLFRSAGDSEQKAYDKMFDAVRFAFLHEIGHALISSYQLPVTGSEEDAADRCSAFINIEELGDEGIRTVLAAAEAFNIESKQKKENVMSDDHLLEQQRFYNSLCMIYGSDSTKYAYLLTDGSLPRERAERCPVEYQKTVESWTRLLAPWRKK